MRYLIHIVLIYFVHNFWYLNGVLCQLQTLQLPKKSEQKPYVLPPCKACTILVESFIQGIEATSRGKHEGGDAAWAEEKLKSYARSELRLTEIQEKLCKTSKFSTQCHTIAEKLETLIEHWWFHKQNEFSDLHKWLCIDETTVCCPPNQYGPNCDDCTDCNGNGKNHRIVYTICADGLCFHRGKCKGNGTRRGNGKCACTEGYDGATCNQCALGYYESFRDESNVLCSICHVSCELAHGCTTAGPNGCRVCSKGWVMEPERGGCVDIDECSAPIQPCSVNQFCVNSEGSHSCLECDRSCNGCNGDGPDLCITCARGYELRDGICADLSRENNQKIVSTGRYITYIGLCIATCVIFQSSTWIAAAIGILVALYITVSEYWLGTYVAEEGLHI